MRPLTSPCMLDSSTSTTALTEKYSSFLNPLSTPEPVRKPTWTPSKSSSLYKVDRWGAPYIVINAEGHMAIRPMGHNTKPHEEMDIMKIVHHIVDAQAVGDLTLPTPLILRFPDVLRHRLESLQFAFNCAIHSHHYQGHFQGVFPVKCNQDRYVVESIVEFGKPFRFGLEAGSKPELLLAMAALCKGSPDALLICNGYKDADYVCLALMAKRLQLNCVIVLEQGQELDVVLKMSRRLGIEPLLGLRAKLNTKHAGHFGETSGENGKFGLSCSQIVSIVQKLRRAGKLHCLQLLHFHIGSQIPSLDVLYDGVSEAAHIYCELSRMGANMQILDMGGGLGIDYDGSSSAESDMSVGYTMEEYAHEVVLAVAKACTMKGVKQPTLCSESGRALVSHHSVLVFDVLSVHHKGCNTEGDKGVAFELEGNFPEELLCLHKSLMGYAQAGDDESTVNCANKLKEDSISCFKQGRLSLPQLAVINSLQEVLSKMMAHKQNITSPSAFDTLSYDGQVQSACTGSLNAVYHVNMSIFKSMPDAWAIGHRFPIVPLHRLGEEPTVRAVLSDLTCDSDGKIDMFISSNAKEKTTNHLKVHPFQDGKPYYMGMFLGGAYQEALGGIHNMFGAPPVVHVSRSESTSKIKLTRVSDGQKAADVLGYMHYNVGSMLEALTLQVQKCSMEGRFGEDEKKYAMAVIRTLACAFDSSTYLSTSHLTSSAFHNLFNPPTVIG